MGSVFKVVARSLMSQSREQALRAYMESLLAAYVDDATLVLYEPDVANRRLTPSLLILQTGKACPIEFPVFDVMDLESPISWSYVMREFLAPAPLQNYVTTSEVFESLKEHFSDNPMIHVCPLIVEEGRQALGVLLIVGPIPVKLEHQSGWKPCLQLFAVLIAKLQHENNQIYQQTDLKRRLEVRGMRELERDRIAQVQKQYIGTDQLSLSVHKAVVSASQNQLALLIQGETGTGKDLLASQVHQLSCRSDKPFVAINCAALPENLVEAEIFGVKRGAYTGSIEHKEGLVEAAEGGVLFLDEIGEMPYALQAVLLRLFNENSYRRIGDTQERKADFRLICATNAPLAEMINQGRFRRDLYYRICQIQIATPPLRGHLDDMGELVSHFAKVYSLETGEYRAPPVEAHIDILKQHHWPGNVRELKNFIFAFLAQYDARESDAGQQLSRMLKEYRMKAEISPVSQALTQELWNSQDLRQANEVFERKMIENRLREFQGNRKKVAESLGLPKRTLAYKCKRLQIDIGRVFTK